MATTDNSPRRPRKPPVRRLDDELDVPLEDAEQLEEVELLSALMIAAGEAEQSLEQQAIDRALGL